MKNMTRIVAILIVSIVFWGCSSGSADDSAGVSTTENGQIAGVVSMPNSSRISAVKISLYKKSNESSQSAETSALETSALFRQTAQPDAIEGLEIVDALSSEDGSFLFSDLTPGVYYLAADFNQSHGATQEMIQLKEGETREVQMILKPYLLVDMLVDAPSADITRAYVWGDPSLKILAFGDGKIELQIIPDNEDTLTFVLEQADGTTTEYLVLLAGDNTVDVEKAENSSLESEVIKFDTVEKEEELPSDSVSSSGDVVSSSSIHISGDTLLLDDFDDGDLNSLLNTEEYPVQWTLGGAEQTTLTPPLSFFESFLVRQDVAPGDSNYIAAFQYTISESAPEPYDGKWAYIEIGIPVRYIMEFGPAYLELDVRGRGNEVDLTFSRFYDYQVVAYRHVSSDGWQTIRLDLRSDFNFDRSSNWDEFLQSLGDRLYLRIGRIGYDIEPEAGEIGVDNIRFLR